MSISVRVRFPPSPTGKMQMGNLRTALFNWLWARHEEGIFVLRLEDTDRERLVPEAAQQITDSLAWLGLTPDEGYQAKGKFGPYLQSERLPLYLRHADQLTAGGKLYPCWCSPERLDDLRKAAQSKHVPFKYDRYCLDHPGDPKQPHVLRFQIPDHQTISWRDLIKGPLEFDSSELDDFVAMKSDNYPTYHFANVVDDHLMQISHVIRGDEWIASTPKHLLLYGAFGWTPPAMAHVPQVLGPDKTKLSKRHGAKSVLEYRDLGYLPEAVMNFLALLGWNDGSEQELYTRAELVQAFALERVQKSAAVFDPERLNWMNGVYIRQLTGGELLKRCEPFWSDEAKSDARFGDQDYLNKVLSLVHERLKYLGELPALTDFFFIDPHVETSMLTKQLEAATAKQYLSASIEALQQSEFKAGAIETTLRSLVDRLSTKPGQLFGLLRVSLTGQTAAPGLFETMAVLGQDAVLRRLNHATDKLT